MFITECSSHLCCLKLVSFGDTNRCNCNDARSEWCCVYRYFKALCLELSVAVTTCIILLLPFPLLAPSWKYLSALNFVSNIKIFLYVWCSMKMGEVLHTKAIRTEGWLVAQPLIQRCPSALKSLTLWFSIWAAEFQICILSLLLISFPSNTYLLESVPFTRHFEICKLWVQYRIKMLITVT